MKTFIDLLNIAQKQQWRLNPNLNILNTVLDKENNDFSKLGKYYCPCKVKKIDENICVCNNAQNEIDQKGHCYCQMFYENNFINIDVVITQTDGIQKSFYFKGKDNLQLFSYNINDKILLNFLNTDGVIFLVILNNTIKQTLVFSKEEKYYKINGKYVSNIDNVDILIHNVENGKNYVETVMKTLEKFNQFGVKSEIEMM
ncbi:MAG: ferredoxin-thioredoxin reductase catalytic domain-containing protein [Acidithiobacillus sp.]|jgi:ferredoxin-thioredoxin reductase catalytic subunit|uniref:ferredoxin-thioredoxin reductase catalytic domain-containing protein n=1 Tax=Acidithiobacillus sp. TaxID=1872118 RepID=UPI003560069B